MKTQFLSVNEVAQELSLTRRDVKQLVKDGLLPGYQFGKHLQVTPEDLEVFINKSKIVKITTSQVE
jgi:excisionase family DNA binding protein